MKRQMAETLQNGNLDIVLSFLCFCDGKATPTAIQSEVKLKVLSNVLKLRCSLVASGLKCLRDFYSRFPALLGCMVALAIRLSDYRILVCRLGIVFPLAQNFRPKSEQTWLACRLKKIAGRADE